MPNFPIKVCIMHHRCYDDKTRTTAPTLQTYSLAYLNLSKFFAITVLGYHPDSIKTTTWKDPTWKTFSAFTLEARRKTYIIFHAGGNPHTHELEGKRKRRTNIWRRKAEYCMTDTCTNDYFSDTFSKYRLWQQCARSIHVGHDMIDGRSRILIDWYVYQLIRIVSHQSFAPTRNTKYELRAPTCQTCCSVAE